MNSHSLEPNHIPDPDGQKTNDQQGSEPLPLEARIEALLFVSSSPVSIGHLADILQVSSRNLKNSMDSLEDSLQERGIRLQKFGSQYQLTTAPELAQDVEGFLSLEDTSTLSRAALEALSIIAYQQPVTRPQIDSIRGVNSDSVLRTLLRHGLIEEAGRSMSPGRPILYSTTSEFLQYFGLAALEDLPPLDPDVVSELGEKGQSLKEPSNE